MRPCDLNTGLGQLTDAVAVLKERWMAAKVHWNDDKSRQFEKEVLAPIPERFQFVLIASQRLSEILEKAARDCNEETNSY